LERAEAALTSRQGDFAENLSEEMRTLVQPEASSHSLRRTLSGELASDKLYEKHIVARTPYPQEIPCELAANGAGFPAGRRSVPREEAYRHLLGDAVNPNSPLKSKQRLIVMYLAFEHCHSCHFAACQNPDHIRPGTRKANMAEAGFRRRGKPNRVLSEAMVRSAKLLRAAGHTIKSIAEEFGVLARTLGLALQGKTWAWVTV
jgi:hypothetical protein